MYDVAGTDTGREWIEVYNTGTSPIDFSVWKLFEANTSHKITAMSSSFIPAGGYAIMTSTPEKFQIDFPHFSGLIFDSVFSLSNEGETIALRNEAGEETDTLTYDPLWGGLGDGNSLQKTATKMWISAPPTPASNTTMSASAPPLEDTVVGTTSSNTGGVVEQTDTYSTHSRQEVVRTLPDTISFEVTAGRPRIGFVGTPLSFEAKKKESMYIPDHNSISYLWSMGDGSIISGQHITHTYQFSGDYTVILNSEIAGVYAVSKVKVRIIDPRIHIAFAGKKYIEISNTDTYEVNIGGWIIETKKKRFIAAQDTIVSPRTSIKIPSNISQLNPLEEYVRITNPLGTIISSINIRDSDQEVSETDPLIILPDGMSPASLEQLLIDTFKKVSTNKSEKASIKKSSGIEKKKTDFLSPPMETSTGTQTIIYTKIKEEDRVKTSWWNRITSFISTL